MQKEIEAYLHLANIFNQNGFNLYLVGGTVRDFLLKMPLTDMDVVTDATPSNMKAFLASGDFTFSTFGSVKYHLNNIKFDITTLRKESHYKDFRHPGKIEFVKSLKIDHFRRDFTINSMYIDSNMQVYDFENGESDLVNKIVKMVGDPNKRLKEDPLRIIRAIRFAVTFKFEIDAKLAKAIIKQSQYLSFLNEDKIIAELKKIKKEDLLEAKNYFNRFSIANISNMIE